MKKIGFIGFGAMGSRIARNLVKAGYEVKGFNRNQAKVTAVSGVQLVESPAAAARDADLLIVMVRDDEASQAVWMHPETGVLSAINATTIAVDMSTLSHTWAAELNQKMQERDLKFLEAPVLGSRPQAEAGELVVLAAGDADAFATVEPVFQVLSAKSSFLGQGGHAAILKLAINSLFAVQTAVFAETLEILRRAGIAEEKIMGILPNIPITSPAMKIALAAMQERKFDPLFPIELVEKDLGYGQGLLESLSVSPSLIAAARQVFAEAREKGFGNHNITGILQLFEQK